MLTVFHVGQRSQESPKPSRGKASGTSAGLFALVATLAMTSGTLAGTFAWNFSGGFWNNAGNWTLVSGTGTAPPGATDIASFDPQNSVGLVHGPVLSASQAVLSLNLNNDPYGDGWGVGGSGNITLTIGGTGSTGLTVRGFGTHFIELGSGSATSLDLSGTASGLNVGTSSQLWIAGNTIAALGTNAITIRGGTLFVDSANNPLATQRITGSGPINLIGGGSTLSYREAAGGTSYTGLTGVLNAGAGDVKVFLNEQAGEFGAGLAVTFGSLARLNPSANLIFTTTSSYTLGGGGVTDPSVQFTSAPTTLQGILSESASTTIPWAVVTRTSGGAVLGDWANYSASNGIVAASSTTFTGNFAAATAGTNVNFKPSANVTLGGSPTQLASVVINPQGTGLSLDLATNSTALNTLGVMLSGNTDFTITGGSLFTTAATSGTRTVMVVDPTASLVTSSNLAASNNPVNKGGDGFLVLSGTADQLNFSTPQNINLAGGTLRAVIQGASLNLGTSNSLAFRGGVLEVDSTGIGGGGSTFSRTLGTGAGQVSWASAAGPGSNTGGGGFSAFGGPLTVNLGGAAAPVTWAGQTGSDINFVQDGYALLFGSTQSNNTVTFLNPLKLDSGTAGTYAIREVSVTLGTGVAADKTQLAGTISGSSTTDLLKTGTGVLELTGTNTYNGNTLIEGGTVRIGADSGLGTIPSSARANSITLVNGGTLGVSTSFTLNANRGILLGSGSTSIGGAIDVPAGQTLIYNGIIIDGGASSLTKTSPGTLQLGGANTYRGFTAINAGTLALSASGSLTSFQITVASGATFDVSSVSGGFSLISLGQTLTGSGRVVGAVTVASSSTIAPGGPDTSTIGKLTLQGNTVFQSGSNLSVAVGGTTAGTTYDQLVLSSGFTLNLGNANLTASFGYTPSSSDKLFIIDNQNASGGLSGLLDGVAQNGTISLGTKFTAQISYTGDFSTLALSGGNDVVLYNLQPTPEPSTILFICAAAAGAAGWLRRRRKTLMTAA